MKSPAAWIPSSVAAQRLRDLARSLGVFSNGTPLVKPIGGPQLITASRRQSDNFPVTFDTQTRTISLPGIYVDFATWHYLPPQTVAGGPASHQNGWLRIVLDVSYDVDDFWGTISVGTPVLEWVLSEDVGTTPGAQFIRSDDGTQYYRYIVRVFQHETPLPWQTSSPLFKQFLDPLT
jgi:hypothetical protein